MRISLPLVLMWELSHFSTAAVKLKIDRLRLNIEHARFGYLRGHLVTRIEQAVEVAAWCVLGLLGLRAW